MVRPEMKGIGRTGTKGGVGRGVEFGAGCILLCVGESAGIF